MMRYEYETVMDPTKGDLNQAGLLGWELVSVTSLYDDTQVAYFRRPVAQPEATLDEVAKALSAEAQALHDGNNPSGNA